ncbi:MAG: enoyl-CoA hydratase/isomerase family protein [Chloroflexi bacterium]|nr:enoyl-CoA hydratase/isomerase family protein [Chloroflexota bacterium]
MAVSLERDDGVGIIKLNRPPANAYDHVVMKELDDAIYEVRFDRAVKVVVLASELPRFFCAGADVASLKAGDAYERAAFDLHAHEVLAKLERTPKLIIAAINGHCLGGGLEIALACDMRFMVDADARIGLTEANLGVIPGTGGTQRLPRLVGLSRAIDLMVNGTAISPQQALELRIVDRLYAADQLIPETMAYAKKLASGPSFAVGRIKLAAVQGSELPMEGALLLERELLNQVFASRDADEGMTAFLEKRQPNYRGE